jgi:hypothetical protein
MWVVRVEFRENAGTVPANALGEEDRWCLQADLRSGRKRCRDKFGALEWQRLGSIGAGVENMVSSLVDGANLYVGLPYGESPLRVWNVIRGQLGPGLLAACGEWSAIGTNCACGPIVSASELPTTTSLNGTVGNGLNAARE